MNTESSRERIRAIVEGRKSSVCPNCGFNKFHNNIHPYAGNIYPSKSKTKWCNGTIVIHSYNYKPKSLYHVTCPTCLKHYKLNAIEFDFFDDVKKCGACYEKEQNTTTD